MKHSALFLLAVLLYFVAGSSFAQPQPHRWLKQRPAVPAQQALVFPDRAPRGINALIRPTRRVSHVWDRQASRWVEGSISTYAYSAKGQPVQVLVADSASNAPQMRTTLTYDAQGRGTEEVSQFWVGSGYVNSSRIEYTYDARGTELLFVYQNWQNNAWAMVFGSRYTNTYTTSGVLTGQAYEGWDSNTRSWLPRGRTSFTVGAQDQWTEILSQEWENGAYVNEYRARNITWYDWAKRLPASYEEQTWDAATNAWSMDIRTTLAFQPNGSYVQISQNMPAPNVWANFARTTFRVDTFGNMLLNETDEWRNDAWELKYGYRQLLSYGAGNAVRRTVGQGYDEQTRQYINSAVDTYSNFITLAASRATGLEAAATLYPNPARATTRLSVSGLREQGAVRGEVLNSLGQVVSQLALLPQAGSITQELAVADFPAGIYTVRLYPVEGAISKRVVKQ